MGQDAAGREGGERGEGASECQRFKDELNRPQILMKPAPGDEVIYDVGNLEQLQWRWVASSRMNLAQHMRCLRECGGLGSRTHVPFGIDFYIVRLGRICSFVMGWGFRIQGSGGVGIQEFRE